MNGDLSIPGNALHERKYSVAVTGDVFRWIIDFGNEDVLQRVSRNFIPCDFPIYVLITLSRCLCVGKYLPGCRRTRSMN